MLIDLKNKLTLKNRTNKITKIISDNKAKNNNYNNTKFNNEINSFLVEISNNDIDALITKLSNFQYIDIDSNLLSTLKYEINKNSILSLLINKYKQSHDKLYLLCIYNLLSLEIIQYNYIPINFVNIILLDFTNCNNNEIILKLIITLFKNKSVVNTLVNDNDFIIILNSYIERITYLEYINIKYFSYFFDLFKLFINKNILNNFNLLKICEYYIDNYLDYNNCVYDVIYVIFKYYLNINNNYISLLQKYNDFIIKLLSKDEIPAIKIIYLLTKYNYNINFNKYIKYNYFYFNNIIDINSEKYILKLKILNLCLNNNITNILQLEIDVIIKQIFINNYKNIIDLSLYYNFFSKVSEYFSSNYFITYYNTQLISAILDLENILNNNNKLKSICAILIYLDNILVT